MKEKEMNLTQDQAQTESAYPSLPKEKLLWMYRTMVLIRRFEETANDLYMQGRIPSTLHLYIGQEAVAVGISAAIRREDYVMSTHRPHGHALAKGVSAKAIMAELFGKASGACKGKGGSMHVGDIAVNMPPAIAIVGGNVPIAAGLALAAKMQRKDFVSVCYFGDGAANEGDWHEAVNCAAIWNLPLLLVCENNLYAASTPFNKAFKIDYVAQRSEAYGIPGTSIDGNDVMEVFRTAYEAVARARRGDGPTLIECLTYRQCGHSRSDPRTYRSKEEEEFWKAKDPILRFKNYLLTKKDIDEKELSALDVSVEEEIKEAVEFAEASPEPDPAEVYTDVLKE